MNAKTNCQKRLSLKVLCAKYRWYPAVTKKARPKKRAAKRTSAVVVIPVNTKAKQRRWTRKNGIECAQFTRSSEARLMGAEGGVSVSIRSPYLLVGRENPSSQKPPLTWTFWQHRQMTDAPPAFAPPPPSEADGTPPAPPAPPPVNLLDGPMLGDLARL